MNSTIQAIESDIRLACLSFKSIAIKHGVTINDVMLVWEQMCEQESI